VAQKKLASKSNPGGSDLLDLRHVCELAQTGLKRSLGCGQGFWSKAKPEMLGNAAKLRKSASQTRSIKSQI